MGTSINLNATSYTIPAVGEDNWGTDVSNYLIALSTGVLSKAGGTFTLSAELDFGTNFGIKSAYYKSRGTVSTAGILRLGNDESIGWKNQAGSANLELKANTSDLLEYDGSPILTLDLGTANQFLSINAGGTAYEWKSILDEDNFASDSATDLATQQSIKAYVDSVAAAQNQAAEITYDNADSTLSATNVKTALDELDTDLDTHVADTTNPHSVTQTQVGLGNVDNTADADKPISDATQTALDDKIEADSTDDLSNKTFTDPVTLQEQGSTPTTPASGDKKLYPKTDGKLYTLDDAGIETEVGSGGGGGGINYIDNSDAETDTTGWTDTTNVTISRETTGQLVRGAGVFNVDITASATTADYTEYQFDLEPADANSVLAISFEHIDGTNFDSGDVDVVLVKDPGGTETEIVPSISELPSTGSSINKLQATWVSQAADTYALRFKVANASTAIDFRFDNVKVGPELSAQGVPQSDWTSYTPATAQNGFGNTANHALQYKRISDSLLIRGFFQAGTVAASEARLDLPTGLTIGGDSGGTVSCGTHYEGRATSANKRTLLGTQGDSYLNFGIWDGSNTPQTPQNGNTITQSSQYQHIETGLIPIAEWAGSSVNLSVAVAEYAYTDSTWDDDSATDGSDTVYSTSGQVMAGTLASQRNKYVKFRTAIQPTDVLKVELSTDGVTWSGEASVNWQTLATFNSTAYGVGIKGQDAADGIARITFGRYRLSTGATYGSAGADWSSSFYWRVVKYPGVIQTATPNAVKWQKKALTSDENTDQTLSDMTFSNLTVGKTYRLSVQAQFSLTGNSSTSLALIDITHNSAVIGRIQARTDSYSGNDDRRFTIGWSFPFVAAASTLTFEYNQGTTNDTVEGSGGATFAILEELPTHVETSEW